MNQNSIDLKVFILFIELYFCEERGQRSGEKNTTELKAKEETGFVYINLKLVKIHIKQI